MEKEIILHGKRYRILRLLGHGKGGYSYLAECEGCLAVLKQIHHEPCDYYSFGNKIEAEQRDYVRLKNAGIRIPEMLDIDADAERIIKEYIDGPTAAEWIQDGHSVNDYLPQVREMAAKAQACGLNIDYYPTNFIISRGLLWYVDYECNDYMPEWDFEHWGIRQWLPAAEFRFDNTLMESLLEKHYWIIDILPKQVPKDSAGQYAAVEQYYLQEPHRSQLRRKYLAIFLKLNCYYDMAVSTDAGDSWSENPEPQKLEEWLLSDTGARTLHVMIPTQNTMTVMDHDDTYITVYNPADELLQMFQMLAGSEGLFMWKPGEQI